MKYSDRLPEKPVCSSKPVTELLNKKLINRNFTKHKNVMNTGSIEW